VADIARDIVTRAILEELSARIDAVKTYDEYRSRLWRACQRLFKGGKERYFPGSFSRSIDQQLSEAWNEGANSVGVSPDDMTDDDLTILEGIINNENDYIDGIAGDIVTDRDAGMKPEDFESQYGSRVDIWAQRYVEVTNTARMHFGGKQKLKWNLGATEKHCPFCRKLNGIVAWATEWEQVDIHPQDPPNRHLSGEINGEKGCKGWKCDCTLDPTDERRTPKAIDRLTEIAMMGNL
jgi:hypothetical protein